MQTESNSITPESIKKTLHNFSERFNSSDTFEDIQFFRDINARENRNDAFELIESGINVYKNYDKYDEAIYRISEALKKYSCADGYFNRGVIHWCEKNYFQCFKDQCSALILEKNSYPQSYFYLADSLFRIILSFQSINKNDKILFFDFMEQMCEFGKQREEQNAINTLKFIRNYRVENSIS